MALEYKKGDLLAEGKTKQIFAVEGKEDILIIVNKDRITAHNAKTAHEVSGKAKMATVTNANVMSYLEKAGVKTSFLKTLDDTSYLARKCKMIPIEWVTRRIATGSFLKRNPGVKEGFRFAPVKLETFYKDDEKDDPEWSKAQVLSIPLDVTENSPLTEQQYDAMAQTTTVVFEILERAWAGLNCTLVDMKVEFGIDQETGEIILSDVIDNDSWRLWEGGRKELMKDKQIYRNLSEFSEEDMKKVKVGYEWVMENSAKLLDHSSQGLVVVFMGSPSDESIAKEVAKHCDKLGLSIEKRIMSAHKVTEQTLYALKYYNSLTRPVVIIAIAGRSNGLGPVIAGNTTLPVINCPPFSKQEQSHDIWSSLSVPSGLGCTTTLYPETAALHAASIFALTDSSVWARLRALQLNRILQLSKADQKAAQ